jgi:hypothetical protein
VTYETQVGQTSRKMKSPTQCVLWENPALVAGPQKDRFKRLDTYVDDDHLTRCLLRCRECGQLYFYEFYEEIDWDGGDDPQYRTYIPVETDTEIGALKKSSRFDLLKYFPRLQRDWPKEAQAPTARWVGK